MNTISTTPAATPNLTLARTVAWACWTTLVLTVTLTSFVAVAYEAGGF